MNPRRATSVRMSERPTELRKPTSERHPNDHPRGVSRKRRSLGRSEVSRKVSRKSLGSVYMQVSRSLGHSDPNGSRARTRGRTQELGRPEQRTAPAGASHRGENTTKEKLMSSSKATT